MKVEISCPDCDGGYLVDADALEAGVPCPECGQILNGGSPDAAPPAAAPVAVADSAVVTAPQVAVQTAVAVAPTIDPVSEVVCPRCNLHFKPRADSQARVRAISDRPMVLIVEDLVYFREIAAEALEGEYEIQAVATKDGARAALDRGGVDLMVLDLTLDGGEGGLDLLRELNAKPCPILIYTAQDESEMYGDSWDELQRLGADDIVLKGMNVGDELTRKIASLLGRELHSDE
jgi:CheY-like chemotaxis protein